MTTTLTMRSPERCIDAAAAVLSGGGSVEQAQTAQEAAFFNEPARTSESNEADAKIDAQRSAAAERLWLEAIALTNGVSEPQFLTDAQLNHIATIRPRRFVDLAEWRELNGI